MLMRAGAAAAQESGAANTIPAPDQLADLGLPDLSGKEISIILGADGPVAPWEEAAVQTFSDVTGCKVTRIAGPESATERLAQYQQLLAAQSSDVDVMTIDVIWPGILASHAVDLTDAMKANKSTYFERIVQNNTVNGILVGIPWYTDAGILYYRTDLLEKYGIENPPATWDDLETAAQTIIDGERAENPDFQGFVWQGGAYEGLTCNALEWQVSNGGGVIVEEDLTVSVNNPQAIASFERARGWVGGISPEGVTTYKEEDARGVWQAGNAAFMRNWPYAYSLGQDPDSVIANKFDVTLVPKGDGDGAQHADCLGGWQMMVSKYSKAPEAATELARFMCSAPIQKAFAIDQSRLPTIPDLYDDADILEANPFFGRLKDVFLGGAVARPSTVTADLYNEVSTAYFTAVNEILTGQAEAAPRVEQLAKEIEGIVAEL
ncbi:MAG: ABC transporter substrate-binding protein [Thermomicrobiales bacterium]|nr:ABC transporter substrate-binding protein [Thermomicrobiales bacterium]